MYDISYMAYVSSAFDLEFILTGIKFDVEFEDEYFDEDEKKDLLDFINCMSQAIFIDKSYVECKGNKHTDTFMIESGWNALCDLVIDSRYCRNTHRLTQSSLTDAFCTMARCYMYELLCKKTDKAHHILLMVEEDCEFDITICKDESREWKTYRGRWQDWEFDDDGNPIVE